MLAFARRARSVESADPITVTRCVFDALVALREVARAFRDLRAIGATPDPTAVVTLQKIPTHDRSLGAFSGSARGSHLTLRARCSTTAIVPYVRPWCPMRYAWSTDKVLSAQTEFGRQARADGHAFSRTRFSAPTDREPTARAGRSRCSSRLGARGSRSSCKGALLPSKHRLLEKNAPWKSRWTACS